MAEAVAEQRRGIALDGIIEPEQVDPNAPPYDPNDPIIKAAIESGRKQAREELLSSGVISGSTYETGTILWTHAPLPLRRPLRTPSLLFYTTSTGPNSNY